MSQVIELQGMLQETQALLAHLEQAARKEPASIGLRINSQSVAKRFQELESEFRRVAAESSTDVCRYRLFGDSQTMAAIAVAASIQEFQRVFSTAHYAIRFGPHKENASVIDVSDDTRLGFGYSFAGSVGIVMTLQNPQMLLESSLDQAMQAVFELAKSQTESDVIKASATLGGPAVRAIHKWAETHVKYNLGIDVEWGRGGDVKGKLLLQVPQLQHLATVLSGAAERVVDNVILTGRVEGCEHVSSRRIHFIADDGTEIKCPYAKGVISEERPIKSPARYQATFRKKARKIIATDQNVKTTYVLTNLKETSTPPKA